MASNNQSVPKTALYAEALSNALEEGGSPYLKELKAYYDGRYDSQIAANNASAAGKIGQAEKNAAAGIEELNGEYSRLNRQLYRDYRQNEKNLPQKLSAMGYSGGLSESSALRLANEYQEALNQNEQSRLGSIGTIQRGLNDSRYKAESEAANANAEAESDWQEALRKLRETEYDTQTEKVENMAKSGDFSGYLALGYSQDEVDYLTRVWLKKNPKALSAWKKRYPAEAKRLGL